MANVRPFHYHSSKMFLHQLKQARWRGGLVVSALDFRSGGRWFELFVATEGKDGNGLKIEKIGCVF